VRGLAQGWSRRAVPRAGRQVSGKVPRSRVFEAAAAVQRFLASSGRRRGAAVQAAARAVRVRSRRRRYPGAAVRGAGPEEAPASQGGGGKTHSSRGAALSEAGGGPEARRRPLVQAVQVRGGGSPGPGPGQGPVQARSRRVIRGARGPGGPRSEGPSPGKCYPRRSRQGGIQARILSRRVIQAASAVRRSRRGPGVQARRSRGGPGKGHPGGQASRRGPMRRVIRGPEVLSEALSSGQGPGSIQARSEASIPRQAV
jgi:hypothetical protein